MTNGLCDGLAVRVESRALEHGLAHLAGLAADVRDVRRQAVHVQRPAVRASGAILAVVALPVL